MTHRSMTQEHAARFENRPAGTVRPAGTAETEIVLPEGDGELELDTDPCPSEWR